MSDKVPDREKVIADIEYYCENQNTAPLHYYGGELAVMPVSLMRDALALLKAQEAREPHYTKLEYIVNGMPVAINHPECPRCYDNGLVLWDAEIEKGAAYCKRCGQAVKWE